jgi:DNA-binding PadR family transcriptional regulator
MRHLKREFLQGHGETLVLAALADGEGYGYQLRKDLAVLSKSYFQFAFGSLYPLLDRLERRGLARKRRLKKGKARERNYYTITAKGLKELQDRKRAWRQFSRAMELVILR